MGVLLEKLIPRFNVHGPTSLGWKELAYGLLAGMQKRCMCYQVGVVALAFE